MWKNAGEKCRKLCISSILSPKRDITPTKIDTHWRVPVNWETEKNEKKRKETERKKTKRKQGEK